MKARNRPPRLDDLPRAEKPSAPAPPAPSLAEVLVRVRVAGKAADSSPSAVRHAIERLDASPPEAWAAVREVFGAGPDDASIDVELTLRAARVAAERIAEVAHSGARIAFATAQPASLFGVHAALARLARVAGAEIDDADDVGPLRVDGRSARYLRWVDGVAVVTDGDSLFGTKGREAADEWLFLAGRPALVVADGPFAVAATEARIDVVAFGGLDRVDLALPAARAERCVVVPVHGGRPARSYVPLVGLLEATFAA
jgi:hypothetical protein